MRSTVTSFIKIDDSYLHQLCLDKGNKEQFGENDIWCQRLKHDGGMYYIYANKTDDKIL